MKKLNILQIGTVGCPVRRGIGSGGAEKVLCYLDEEYTKRGYNSIVAAPKDSDVAGILFPTMSHSIGVFGKNQDDAEVYEKHYKKCMEFILENKIDIIHDHPGRGFVNSRAYLENKDKIKTPILITNHGSQLPGLEEQHKNLKRLIKKGYPIYINALSKFHKNLLEKNEKIEIIDFIYHGVPVEKFEFNDNPKNYLFCLGRICEQKGQHIAVQVARRTQLPLILGGEIEDENYFNEKIKPYLNKKIKLIGFLNDTQKVEWYKNSFAYLVPITGPETFGLTLVESLACGTPVIAFNYGAVSEIVEDNKTGFVINPIKTRGKLNLKAMTNEMSNAILNIDEISRYKCRKSIEEKFSIQQEANAYLNLYNQLITQTFK